MKYVICRYNGETEDSIRLTEGKIYKVLEEYDGQYGHIILIEDNTGTRINYLLRGDKDIIWFEDAQSILRNNKLNSLGI